MKRSACGVAALTLPLVLLAMTMSAARATAQSASIANSRVALHKSVDNPWLQVGDTVTFTLRFANVSNDIRVPVQVQVVDVNPASRYLEILTPTITGDAWYSPTIDGVVWEDMLFWGDAWEVTFQARVLGLPEPRPVTGFVVTNTVTIADLRKPGTLPEQKAQAVVRLGAPRVLLPVVAMSSRGQD